MKTYRVYFNREREWPQCWSIDEGDQATEINVCGFVFLRVMAQSRTRKRDAAVDPDKTPFAWLEVVGHLRLTGGVAYFSNQEN